MKPVFAYLATGIVFLMLDAGWLALAGPRLYRPEIGALLADKVRFAPAVAFYLLYVAGLIYFCVWPGFSQGWARALVSGLALGLVAYGAYDLTCYAVMRTWSLKVTVLDLAWGAFASAAAATVGVLATQALFGRAA